MPISVPMEINKGNVYAIPKLMLKLNRMPRAELMQRYIHGTFSISSTFSKCRASGIGHKKSVLNRPMEERKRAIW